MQTNDGGETWEEDTIPELKNWYGGTAEATIIFSIQFLNDTLGWLTCADEDNSGYILLTTDGGENWQQQFVFYKPIYDICMVDNNNGWAVGDDIIYHTNNGDTIIITEINENKYEDNFFTIIPNPSTGVFEVKIKNQLPANTYNLIVTDIVGNSIYLFKNLTIEELYNQTIDLTILPAGIYYITIKYSSKHQIHSLTKKIIRL
jgi:photosystem II stability/assembly factor-like uncharacterized protein